ncbi:hypothetical protein G3I44_10940 [Halogeometricum borinquense]|uniref:Uncharacterized protein n=1 Tax=Halogeometricum borinquense TaxID=60847 RepID=A0A6C0UGY5_9EURY|nr:hypothetical protein [Halogeometricum borinquense]QIB74756.1 hypothetical protein G3I44_10940 [Halogeometricum borinquense]
MSNNTLSRNKSTVDADNGGSSPNRKASINHDPSGDPIGVALWINADELAALGIDATRTDAVKLQVTDGELNLIPVRGEGSEQ